MKQETKQCATCKSKFVIEPDDFTFYEKIKVPPPTFCSSCRWQRRYAWRNEMNLHNRPCDFCKKDIISMYPKNTPFPVYCQKCWWGDMWNAIEYGQEYNFNEPFFKQFKTLQNKVPRPALTNQKSIHSEYTNYAIANKNCYLCYSIGNSEDCFYSGPQTTYTKNSVSCGMSHHNEYCYESVDCQSCYQLSFSQNCKNCIESSFLFDCQNCQNCLGCINLRNKQYHIFNKSYSKEEYAKKLEGLDLGNHDNLKRFEREFNTFRETHIHRFATIINSTNSTGDNITNCKNCHNCFEANESENCNHCFIANHAKNSYDTNSSYPSTEGSYEAMSVIESPFNKLSLNMWANSSFNTYSDTCASSTNLFGCISLRKKEYCILNKQYSKKKYEELIPEIIKHMTDTPYTDSKGLVYKYGEFFSIELSPLGYNETVSHQYFPLTKNEAVEHGYQWTDPEERELKTTIQAIDIPKHIKDASDSIINDVIECEHKRECNEACTGAFKIQEAELEFYKRFNFPLPRTCIKCRNYSRTKRRNTPHLWHRKCMCAGKTSNPVIPSEDGYSTVPVEVEESHSNEIPRQARDDKKRTYINTINHQHHGKNHCPNEFETTYAPNRPEIIYCEQCYNSEVA
jgi:hypothetical protein